jgi:uncharacterized membrane protein (UPF0127 family)
MVCRTMKTARHKIVHSIDCVMTSIALVVIGLSHFSTSISLASTNVAEPLARSAPKFKKRKIIIGSKVLLVEIADTDERRAYGLMFREKLAPDEAMLFIFPDEEQRSFWMQNTLIPLSIGYFSRDKVLNEVIDMQPAVIGASRPKTYPNRKKAMFALETNIGWYERNKIRPGVSFRFADN